MNDSEKLLNELKDIRNIMERSNRFLSLSGLSGILVGLFALIGAFLAYRLIYTDGPVEYQQKMGEDVLFKLFILGVSVLLVSLITILFLTVNKAKREHKPVWGPGSKLLLLNLLIPLVTGGILIIALVLQGYYAVVSPSFLIFYGLALVNAAKYTRPEILSLGIIEIVLGLVAAILPDFGLYLWAAGFGVVHIVYGFLYLRNESKKQ